MNRSFYTETIEQFLVQDEQYILGVLTKNSHFDIDIAQRNAWEQQVRILKSALCTFRGQIILEYTIPRMGKRADVIIIIANAIFVLEFKVGENTFPKYAIDQVWDYALDLKYFHETSQRKSLVPILVSTHAARPMVSKDIRKFDDGVFYPILSNASSLEEVINTALQHTCGDIIDGREWESGGYSPTPTIIEAAVSLYNNHSVKNITRNDAGAKNLNETSEAVLKIIEDAKRNNRKSICFVTGVPGAGKTLVGLNIATRNIEKSNDASSVFLSGNGPLVAVLQEALTRDKLGRERASGVKITKKDIQRSVKLFIQNVHHFRDEYLATSKPPFDHVAIFDEAQRAWDHNQTAKFMSQKKGKADFDQSEPEFLISCLDRHEDWAVIVCLVGGGQEINTGEAGISEWIGALNRSFPHWNVFVSSSLSDNEYASGMSLDLLKGRDGVNFNEQLHLSVSMRSFRAEYLSQMVKCLLDLEPNLAREVFSNIEENYPIAITRDVGKAKKWLKQMARGTERYGIVVSSQAQRLKPYAIDVKSPIDPVKWFLNDKEDVRSSYYLEDVATEFHVQGLELDWTCVTWDADMRFAKNEWEPFSFKGSNWERIRKAERRQYLKNAYRVLLTRARQGMVIVVPNGEDEDPTRKSEWYDPTWNYLSQIGFQVI